MDFLVTTLKILIMMDTVLQDKRGEWLQQGESEVQSNTLHYCTVLAFLKFKRVRNKVDDISGFSPDFLFSKSPFIIQHLSKLEALHYIPIA